MANYAKNEIHQLEISQVKTDPNQPRKYFDKTAMEELTKSVRKHGVIQPILVRESSDEIMLVAGERRLKAAGKASMNKIPAIFVEVEKPDELSLIENLQRADLTSIEEAEALQQIKETHGYNSKTLANIIGKAESSVSETLKLTALPEDIRKECRKDLNWSKSLLLEIAKQETERKMRSLFRRIKRKGLNRDQARLETRKGAKHQPKPQVVMKRLSGLNDYIKKIDLSVLVDADKKSVCKEMQSLKKQIDLILKKM